MREMPGALLPLLADFLEVATLLLAIPSILIPTPSIPLPTRIPAPTRTVLSKSIVFLSIFALSLVPTSIFRMLSDILLVTALSGTYLLPRKYLCRLHCSSMLINQHCPAVLHVMIHQFHRPLSIVLPSDPAEPSDSSFYDDLLQRKEHALQRQQRVKRIMWDIAVFILLVPVGGGGFAWATGRMLGRW
jgi:hypothetical protein